MVWVLFAKLSDFQSFPGVSERNFRTVTNVEEFFFSKVLNPEALFNSLMRISELFPVMRFAYNT